MQCQVDVDETTGQFTIDMDDAPIMTFNGATGSFVSVGDGTTSDNSLSLAINADTNPFKAIDVDFS